MRTIDADELKKKLEAEHCDCEVIQIIDDMPTAVEAEPVKQRRWIDGWISVDDRLPPKGCDVLVCDFDDYAGVGFFDGDKWNIDGFEMSTPPVSHWQPLPEPPERSNKS